MNPPSHCLECSAPLTSADAGGLCPKCLLRLGLASQFGERSIADAGARKFVAPPRFPFDFGGYRVLRLLGRGGMGAVYEAEQHATGRRVALKVLGHTIDSPEMRKRFLREGRLAASVNHPNTVYIFGTEEIEGAPVIAMELVAGGTLRDRVKRGPLAVREAVDATLQIIAGLDAAAGAGVLHRDVKPANCFVAPDGTVKVGDFGLSVSTLARSDTQITASGTMLGTPSFAAPEQLRCDDLDVRADIYSTGATLYSMLTGHAPFEGDNAVQVVAAVLNDAPKPIADFRKDVPAGLAQIVARCLAKKRGERFASYGELRDALVRFSSQAREPAPLGRRIVAGALDLIGALVPLVCFGEALTSTYGQAFVHWPRLSATQEWWQALGCFLLMLGIFLAVLVGVCSPALYFAFTEGRWGASPGKALCGLRVVRPNGGAPGVARGCVRGLLFVGSLYLSIYLTSLIPWRESFSSVSWGSLQFRISNLSLPLWLGCFFALLAANFVTMRRRNGFAALHDLLSGTRVIVRAKANARPHLAVPSSAGPAVESDERVGPFRVGAPIAGAWFAGRDEVLCRNVWIRKWDAEDRIPSPRRDPGRAGRLRWIAGARDAAAWDAFDAPTGKPFLEVVTKPQPWAAVRYWLLDLAEELDAAAKDGTLPREIGLDHVWITADGRALLLDEPWPGAEPSTRFSCAEIAGAQRFLAAFAHTALDRSQLPLHARDFLKKLGAAAFVRASFLAGNLRSLLAKPAALSRRRRFASLASAPGLALLIASVFIHSMLLPVWQEHAKWARHPELRALPPALDYLHGRAELAKGLSYTVGTETTVMIPDGKGTRPYTYLREFSGNVHYSGPSELRGTDSAENAERAAKYIAGHFGSFIPSAEFDREPLFSHWTQEQRDALREIVRTHPAVSAAELAEVDARLKFTFSTLFAEIFSPFVVTVGMELMRKVAIVACGWQLALILIFGMTLGQRLFGFAVVDRSGAPASRPRLLGRWFVGWIPLFIIWLIPNLLFAHWPDLEPHTYDQALAYLLVGSYPSPWPWFGLIRTIFAAGWIVWLGGFIAAILEPARGPHDRLARTRLVPR